MDLGQRLQEHVAWTRGQSVSLPFPGLHACPRSPCERHSGLQKTVSRPRVHPRARRGSAAAFELSCQPRITYMYVGEVFVPVAGIVHWMYSCTEQSSV